MRCFYLSAPYYLADCGKATFDFQPLTFNFSLLTFYSHLPHDKIASMTHAEQIASQLNVKPSQVTAVINLLDEGNTVPFIARYRKEMTGSLDDEQIRIIADELIRLR